MYFNCISHCDLISHNGLCCFYGPYTETSGQQAAESQTLFPFYSHRKIEMIQTTTKTIAAKTVKVKVTELK